VALRTLLRHRSQLVEHRSPHIQQMQKALLQMNVQLSQAVTDVTGMTGQAIIRAILAGVRDSQTLAAMQEPGCKKSAEEIGKALTGTWREEHLFILQQSVAMYDFYTQQIHVCDEEIERLYGMTRPDWEAGEVQPLNWRKRNSHSKNIPHNSEAIRKHLKRISGVDLSVVDGFGVSLAQTVIMEVGTDMSKFPNDKPFCAWLGLAPKHEISGGKVLKNNTLKTKNRAGQAFRMAANSVKQADGPNGGVWSVAFSPDGKILASGNVDSTIVLWDVDNHRIIGQPLRGHTDQLRGWHSAQMAKPSFQEVWIRRLSSGMWHHEK
jgi:transposase